MARTRLAGGSDRCKFWRDAPPRKRIPARDAAETRERLCFWELGQSNDCPQEIAALSCGWRSDINYRSSQSEEAPVIFVTGARTGPWRPKKYLYGHSRHRGISEKERRRKRKRGRERKIESVLKCILMRECVRAGRVSVCTML